MSSSRTYITDHVVQRDDPNPITGTEAANSAGVTESVPPAEASNPTSPKQIRANRKNARLSTGPKTPQGKAIASRNSIKHGLFARDILLKSRHHSESLNEYTKLMESLFEELQPETLFQEHLVRKIGNCMWRSRRAVIAETAYINHSLAEVDYEVRRHIENREFLAKLGHEEAPVRITRADKRGFISFEIGDNLIPRQEASHNILWYEMRLDRQLTRAYMLLNSLKKRPALELTEPGLTDPEKSGDENL